MSRSTHRPGKPRHAGPVRVTHEVAPRDLDRPAWLQTFETALYEEARERGRRRGAGQYDQVRGARVSSYDVFVR